MSVKQVEVAVADLCIGMYACDGYDKAGYHTGRLDFLINDTQTLQELQARYTWIVVDSTRSSAIARRVLRYGALEKRQRRLTEVLKARVALAPDSVLRHLEPAKLTPEQDDNNQAALAFVDSTAAMEQLSAMAAEVLAMVQAEQPLSHAQLEATLAPVVQAVVHDPEAMQWLLPLQNYQNPLHRHMVYCAVLAVFLGIQWVMSPAQLLSLAKGGLLMKLGLAHPRCPETLQYPGMEGNDADIRSYLQLTQEIYYGITGGKDLVAEQMVRYHAENMDGTGFAVGMKGSEIPRVACMARIVDAFVAMSAMRQFSADEILQKMRRKRAKIYHGLLLDRFIVAMSLYPVGTLVELNSGEVALVKSHNAARKLRPVLLLLTDSKKRLRRDLYEVDLLLADLNHDDDAQLSVVASLPDGAYGLALEQLTL